LPPIASDPLEEGDYSALARQIAEADLAAALDRGDREDALRQPAATPTSLPGGTDPLCDVQGDTISSQRAYRDVAAVMAQLGLVPAAE
jgi:muramidase (phage lysozyme)